MLRTRRLAVYLVVALTLLDALWKHLALQHLVVGELVHSWFGVAGIMLHKNYGVVANVPIPLWVVIPVSVLIILGCGLWLKKSIGSNTEPWPTRLQLGLVTLILGASGNLVDRMINGFTTDYLILFGRSVVNVADGLILLGVAAIIFSTNTPSTKPPLT